MEKSVLQSMDAVVHDGFNGLRKLVTDLDEQSNMLKASINNARARAHNGRMFPRGGRGSLLQPLQKCKHGANTTLDIGDELPNFPPDRGALMTLPKHHVKRLASLANEDIMLPNGNSGAYRTWFIRFSCQRVRTVYLVDIIIQKYCSHTASQLRLHGTQQYTVNTVMFCIAFF